MPDLITLADLQSRLSGGIPAEHAAVAAGAVSDASAAVEAHCRRPLALASYDRVYRPGRTRKIYLDAWPVAQLVRLKTDLLVVANVQNGDPTTNQAAFVSRTATTLTLTRIASGVTTAQPFTLASYQTVGQLAAALAAAGGGWTAATTSATPNPAALAVSELNADTETQGALSAAAELRAYLRDVNRYVLHPDTGVIELTENLPQAFRYADRAWTAYGSLYASAEPRHAGVRAVYRAGYAVAQADLDAGLAPVPDDLKRAVVLAVSSLWNVTGSPQIRSASDGVLSYGYGEAPAALPDAVKNLLGKYVNKRIA